MKKTLIVSLTALFLVLFSANCFAANWVWVDSDSKVNVYFDSNTAKYVPSTSNTCAKLYFWVKITNLDNESYIESVCDYNGYMHEYTWYVYNSADQKIASGNHNGRGVQIVPGTNTEKLMYTVCNYCVRKNARASQS